MALVPPEVALAGFDPRYARVLAEAALDDVAIVLLDTNGGTPTCLYQVAFRRTPEGWREGASSNGPGSVETRAGWAVSYWPDQPEAPDVRAVTVSYAGRAFEVPVIDGWWLFTALEADGAPHPRVTRRER